jgi:Flp pilus assembly pilin Flp
LEHRPTGQAGDETPGASPEEGAIMVEHSFLMMLIAIAAAATVLKFGGAVRDLFQSAVDVFEAI